MIFALTTMQFVTSIEWVLILENIFLLKRIYEISQVWILFIVHSMDTIYCSFAMI